MWYVIQVASGQENATLELLQHFVDGNVLKEAFIPRREILRHRAGEWHKTQELLFPGYIFVVTRKPDELYAQLGRVPAFTRLLGNDRKFIPLIEDEISLINVFGGKEHLVQMSEGVIEGDEIKILKGPLKDHGGIIRKIDRHKRLAHVEMWILGRSKIVKLGLEIVRKS